MPASLFDSAAYRDVLRDSALQTLFSDTAVVRAHLLVMGALALTQARAGLIPDVSAQAIQRAALEVQVDPAALRMDNRADPVAALIPAFQAEIKAPEHSKWLHHDSDTHATDATAFALRMRQVLTLLEERLGCRDTDALRTGLLCAYHPDPSICAGLAKGLGLTPAPAGHTPRDGVLALGDWLTAQVTTLRGEQPVLVAIQQQMPFFNAMVQDTATDDAIRLTHTMILPQMCLGLGSAALLAKESLAK